MKPSRRRTELRPSHVASWSIIRSDGDGDCDCSLAGSKGIECRCGGSTQSTISGRESPDGWHEVWTVLCWKKEPGCHVLMVACTCEVRESARAGVKRPLLDDLEWFLKDETRTFYAKHGIPYHRCYLLHGEPGTGKTSFMNSVAGHIQRNLCFIQMDKHMTDDTFRHPVSFNPSHASFRAGSCSFAQAHPSFYSVRLSPAPGNAMTQLPALSMVVLEDVDALFTNHREADHNNSSLHLGSTCCVVSCAPNPCTSPLPSVSWPACPVLRSFSGFLNCLDGLGAPDDVVIFMTTNHPDKLVPPSESQGGPLSYRFLHLCLGELYHPLPEDPAVMRPGRIDLKAEFKKPSLGLSF